VHFADGIQGEIVGRNHSAVTNQAIRRGSVAVFWKTNSIMKKSLLLPVLLGLLLGACSRTNSDAQKLSSNDQSDPNRPLYNDQAATAGKDAVNQSQGMAANQVSATSNGTMTAAANTDAGLSPTPPTPMTATAPSTDVANADNNNTPKTDLSARLAEWKLNAEDIKSEFETNGRIERSRTAGAGEPTGPMDDILTSQISGKLKEEPSTSGLSLDVATDKGVVTLTGAAHSLDEIGKAIAVSLDTPGVTKAVSEIKLEANR